ncbi:MAG: class I SAM-dependent methyltransferase [Sciscionella sp.]
MDIGAVKDAAFEFDRELLARKRKLSPATFDWYPHSTMGNAHHLDALLTGEQRTVMADIAGSAVADVGGADGDWSFFLEQHLGCQVDLIDNEEYNCNHLRGARCMKQDLGSDVAIHSLDLDSQFALPRNHYGAVFFLGTLYHLKNPYYVMEALAKRAELCFVSTRIAQLTPDHRTRIDEVPVAYLLHSSEANNDSTNYWIFSKAALLRLFARTGWDVLDFMTVGCTEGSDPASPDRDERAFALLRSRVAAERAR